MQRDIRHIIPISGKDSLATAILQTAKEPDLNYEYVFNPTGLELPEVFEWLFKVEKYLGQQITRVGKPLKPIIEAYNYFLPSQRSRYCTRESKIEPFIDWIGGDDCIVFYGIRSDEKRLGFDNKESKNIIAKYPLADMGIDLEGVYFINNSKGLKPPVFYWKRLHDEVTKILGFDPKKILPEWIFDVLFAWRSRANCNWCFNQRNYEWIGLLEFYPNMFYEAKEFEHLGSINFERKEEVEELKNQLELFSGFRTESIDELKGMFTWSSNKKSLDQMEKEKHVIFKKRVNQVVNNISRYTQLKIFSDESENEIIDILKITSCGLFCGK